MKKKCVSSSEKESTLTLCFWENKGVILHPCEENESIMLQILKTFL